MSPLLAAVSYLLFAVALVTGAVLVVIIVRAEHRKGLDRLRAAARREHYRRVKAEQEAR